MKKIINACLGGVLVAMAAASAVSPAYALGGCGPNMHRGHNGRCYWGGQNEAWCLHHTGHRAVRMPNGELVCYR